jgi:nicotinamide mononucleotide (NMN) deamidase PncC
MSGAVATEMRRAERPGGERLQVDPRKLRSIRPREYAIRFGFGFAMSVIAAGIGELAGPRVGGVFLAFPAILFATVTLVEKKEGIGQAATDIRGATFGAIGMIAFAIVVALLVDRSPALALVAALLAWIVVSGTAYLGVRGLLRAMGERQYLPEIPTSDAATLVGLLIARGMTVATADALTGGTLSALLCSVPDADRVFRAGLVAPIEDLATLLGATPGLGDFPAEDPRALGIAGADVAAGLARALRVRTGADLTIAVAAGNGSHRAAPPGEAWVAVSIPDGRVLSRPLQEDLSPGRNRERAVCAALRLATTGVSTLGGRWEG